MPILSPDTLEFISRGPEQTHRVGARLGMLLHGDEVIALEGDLGAGKTVLAQGIGVGWGATVPLISPTFVLIRRHTRPQDAAFLYHIDFYRLEEESEIWALGVEELLGNPDTVCVVEWADRAPDLFTDEYLWVTLRWLDQYRRSLVFRATGTLHQALLDQFRKEIIGHHF
ncbi:MAG: tRNA (adenosine(37)-N6)-threonylcarbamoyltransferase complex ATPase subunit type 1 TsaE [Anaerolineae bacterium]|nr:tRNA (adenosine(37)-N6)-threonylcarbamoyltransferase complex ATPase subunit type 1 TsaE [Anaerolineae bacterium]